METPPSRVYEYTAIEMILNSFIMHLGFVQARESLTEVLPGKNYNAAICISYVISYSNNH